MADSHDNQAPMVVLPWSVGQNLEPNRPRGVVAWGWGVARREGALVRKEVCPATLGGCAWRLAPPAITSATGGLTEHGREVVTQCVP